MTNTSHRHKMTRPKFYLARRCTRWDVYPQREPLVAIAHDYQGFWAQYEPGKWFKSPASYVFHGEISEERAVEHRTQYPDGEA